MKFEHSLGLVIQRRRIALGLGQRQLAERTDQYQANVSWHETGARVPSLVTLIAYAGALECTLLELIAEAQFDAPPSPDYEPQRDDDDRRTRRNFMRFVKRREDKTG
jgi:transcriptional regulator with XRE-family HTH domain